MNKSEFYFEILDFPSFLSMKPLFYRFSKRVTIFLINYSDLKSKQLCRFLRIKKVYKYMQTNLFDLFWCTRCLYV